MLSGVLGRYIQGGDTFKGALLLSVSGILNTFLVLLCLHVYMSGSLTGSIQQMQQVGNLKSMV